MVLPRDTLLTVLDYYVDWRRARSSGKEFYNFIVELDDEYLSTQCLPYFREGLLPGSPVQVEPSAAATDYQQPLWP